MTEQPAGQDLAAQIAGKQVQAGRATAFDLVKSMETEFAKALPKHVPVEQFMRTAITELRQSPDLQQCSAESLLGAFLTAARLGLEVGGPMGEFYLTPRKVKGVPSVVPIVGYRGLLELARRSGRVGAVGADLVREGDIFEQGFDTTRGGKYTIHKPLDYEETRPILGVLAWAEVGNTTQAKYMPMSKVMERKARGAAGDFGPWKTDLEAMIQKTGFRALAPSLPQSSGLALARQVDEQVQTFVPGETVEQGDQS
jgi:recombination protein RecT